VVHAINDWIVAPTGVKEGRGLIWTGNEFFGQTLPRQIRAHAGHPRPMVDCAKAEIR
jgi:hypothetical protein